MKNFYKIVSLMLAVLLTAVFLTGCTGHNGNETNTPEPANQDIKSVIRKAVGTGGVTTAEFEKAYAESLVQFS